MDRALVKWGFKVLSEHLNMSPSKRHEVGPIKTLKCLFLPEFRLNRSILRASDCMNRIEGNRLHRYTNSVYSI